MSLMNFWLLLAYIRVTHRNDFISANVSIVTSILSSDQDMAAEQKPSQMEACHESPMFQWEQRGLNKYVYHQVTEHYQYYREN